MDPAEWRATDPGLADRLTRRLDQDEVAALVALAAKAGARPAPEIGKTAFDGPAIERLIAELRDAVMHGAGALILTGLDPAALPPGAFERIFWGLGTHLGTGAIQGPDGARIARVEKRAHNPEGRGTLMDSELHPHTDMHEILALACVREAASGGESMLVSAAALHAAIRARDPAAVAVLGEGYYAGINAAVGGAEPVSAEKLPIFSTTAGKLSCWYNRFFLGSAARAGGEALPADLMRAMAIFDAEALRPGLGFVFRLRPGEMVFWHNWTCLHARTAFHDAGDARRLLLRLWLNVDEGRPVDPRVAARARTMDADHQAAFERRTA